MQIALRNVNQVWAYILTQTLKRLGLTCAVICPGSRSTPLTVAFAQLAPDIEAIPILDERSAAFFALGQAKATGCPVVLVCTSGTAGANFYPAVIEAKESRVPLLILTADRPQELRECHSGQTIDQVRLYGNYPNWQAELALPSLDMGILAYLRQTIIYAWERCQAPTGGAVHLNIPFRDPLAPIADGTDFTLHPEEFFAGVVQTQLPVTHYRLPKEWKECKSGLIIAGVAQPQRPQEYCSAIAKLSQSLNWPILAEGLSPVRNYAELNPYLISTYDLILRNQQFAKQLTPEMVIQIGEMPTSKELRNWINATQPQRWIIDNSDQNLDPLHGRTTHLRISVEELVEGIGEVIAISHQVDMNLIPPTPLKKGGKEKEVIAISQEVETNLIPPTPLKKGGKEELDVLSFKRNEMTSISSFPYLQKWCDAEVKVREAVDKTMVQMDKIIESKAAWLISQTLPPETPLFISNSMPVRDVEFFWKPNNLKVKSYFNRGANGIDGTLSTALGIAHRQQSSVMLTGDLALLHDTNGFLIRNKFVGHLTIILINNNGGGIFEMLPIANFEPPFEEFFATPQDIDFALLCATYNVQHELIISWEHLQQRLNPLPNKGIRVLEVRTNRKLDAKWRKENLGNFAVDIGI